MPLDRAVLESICGKIANVESLFSPWDNTDIEGENWNEPISNEHIKSNIQYPSYLCICNEMKLNKLLNLEPIEVPIDPKAKKDTKKEPKKGAIEIPLEITEKFIDEHGRKLPVMFKEPDENSEEFKKCDIIRNFRGSYSSEQVRIRCEQNELSAKIKAYQSDNTADNTDIIKELEDQLQNSLNARNLDMEKPSGGEVDPILCQSYRILSRFASNITGNHPNFPTDNHSQKDFDTYFLWRAIYPQIPASGKPVYNPTGKYCVRLFLAGQWRKVYVDGDTVPIKEDGSPALASSEDLLELWPFILAKAIYTVYSACG